MAYFRATIKGNRGETSKEGTKDSGISGHVRGWDSGVEVSGYVDSEGRDCFDVYSTGGSNGSASRKLVGSIIGGEWVSIEKAPHLLLYGRENA